MPMMLCAWFLLACMVAPAIGEARLDSAVANAAEVKVGQKSDADALHQQNLELQKELSDIPSVKEATLTLQKERSAILASITPDIDIKGVEEAFKLPADLQHDDWLPKPTSYAQLGSTPAGDGVDLSSWKRPAQVVAATQPYEDTYSAAWTGAERDKASAKEASFVPTDTTEDIVTSRPSAAAQKPDYVTFGLFAKTFYGASLPNKNFVVDVVMTFKWLDQRVIALIPSGLDEVTLSKKESEKQIWLPGMVITNRDIKSYDLISTSVIINRKGEVFKVERSTATVKNKYKLAHYPYDTQKLAVKIASSKYMIDEVVLRPSTEGNGAAPDLLKGYNYLLEDVSATAIEDVDGALKKSRGVLTITVKRDADQYFQSHLIPAALLACVSCGIHWFPFMAPFITPRAALSTLAILAFTNLMMKSNSLLPPGSGFNWNDCVNQTVLILMFLNIFMNIVGEGVFHHFKVEDVGRTINHDCKVLMPCLFILSVGTIMFNAGPDGWLSLKITSIIVKTMICLILGSYLLHCASKVNVALATKRAEESAKQKSVP